jgi:DNA ligase-1
VQSPNPSLSSFALVSDSLAADRSKLTKARLLADYLRPLAASPDDLRRAVWFSSGRTFSPTDPRVTGVSSAAFRDAVLSLTSASPAHWRELAIRAGEAGEALALLYTEKPWATPTPSVLTLADLSAAFDQLAATGEQQPKRALLTRLLSRASSAREAAYLGKILFGDLRTGVAEGVLLDALASAFTVPADLCRRALLLTGDLGEVAALAAQGPDALTAARFKLFHPLSFMLAAVVQSPEDAAAQIEQRPFVAEDKLDGIRAQIHLSPTRTEIYTRTLDAITESFPDVVQQLAPLAQVSDLILDGEIVPWSLASDDDASPQIAPFARLQARLGRKDPSPELLAEYPARFIAFDLLYHNGNLLLDHTLRDRRTVLEQLPGLLLLPQVSLSVGESLAPQIATAFDAARARKNEGILLKDLTSPYSPGRRGQLWYKLKSHLPTLDCVVTAAEHGHGKRRNSLSDYTFAVWSQSPSEPTATLLNIGKAFSGVTDKEIAQLTALFRDLSTHFDGRVHQVTPKVVLEIAFDAIQKSPRHPSGYALRFPRIKRIRWDKRPEDADTLQRVEDIYNSPNNLNRNDPPPPDSTPTKPPKPKRKPKPDPGPTLFDF